tara:strand:- start:113 stop:820 length:708 start_codon:yes stop_codon:yes gene_type:complete
MGNEISIIYYRKKIENNLVIKLIKKIQLKINTYNIIKSINKKNFNVIYNKYINFDPYPGYSKYLNIKPWIVDMLWRIYILKLDKRKNLNILDIGTGNGYFPYCCKYFNHQVESIDTDKNPLFNELINLLSIKRKTITIKKYQKLEPFNGKFDLITGFHIYFNGHRTTDLWGKDEWLFFLKDLKDNHCNTNAELFFILNKEHDTGLYYDNDLLKFFLDTGAEVDVNRIYYPNLKSV